jgi:hypothetical protein
MAWQLFRDRADGGVDRAGDLPALADPEALFWASPVGRATRARQRGDRFFQIELDDATLAAYAEAGEAGGRRARRAADLLGQIEELGWHLEHVSWWRVDGDDHVANGAALPHPGVDHVRGVYLFHAVADDDVDAAPPPASTNGAAHSPTHRRDVL